MSLEETSAFDFGEKPTLDAETTVGNETTATLELERVSTFDCPSCDATAPSTAVPYNALGYAVCPACGHSTDPGVDE